MYEPHGNTFTVGKIMEWLGAHFLVLETPDRYVKVQLRQGNVMQEILVEANCFASVSFLLNGYYHHMHSILLEESDDGLRQWVAYHNGRFPDFYHVLLNHYTSLGIL